MSDDTQTQEPQAPKLPDKEALPKVVAPPAPAPIAATSWYRISRAADSSGPETLHLRLASGMVKATKGGVIVREFPLPAGSTIGDLHKHQAEARAQRASAETDALEMDKSGDPAKIPARRAAWARVDTLAAELAKVDGHLAQALVIDQLESDGYEVAEITAADATVFLQKLADDAAKKVEV